MREFTPGMIYVHTENDAYIEFLPSHYDRVKEFLPHSELKIDAMNKITRAMQSKSYHHNNYNKFWAQIFTDTPVCAIVTSTNSMDVLEKENPNFHLIVDQFEVYDEMILNNHTIEVGFHDGMITPAMLTDVLFKLTNYLVSQYKPLDIIPFKYHEPEEENLEPITESEVEPETPISSEEEQTDPDDTNEDNQQPSVPSDTY